MLSYISIFRLLHCAMLICSALGLYVFYVFLFLVFCLSMFVLFYFFFFFLFSSLLVVACALLVARQFFALEALANIVAGSDAQTQAAIDAGLIAGLAPLLHSPKVTDRCWSCCFLFVCVFALLRFDDATTLAPAFTCVVVLTGLGARIF
jgi:hypothetical protein